MCVLFVTCRRHGNYYSVGRTRIQDYVPIFAKFINIDWTNPVQAAEPESIAVRNYLRQVRRQTALSGGKEKWRKEGGMHRRRREAR